MHSKRITARRVSTVSFWIGMAAASAIPFVPAVYRWFYPPRQPSAAADGLSGVLVAVIESVAIAGDGIAIEIWTVGLLALAVIASLVAFVAAWRAGASRRRKMWCGLPALLALGGLMLLLA